jgi:hypothetical protein
VSIPASPSAEVLATALSSMQNVGEVEVQRRDVDLATNGATYDITFTGWPEEPYENNVHVNDGNPPLSDFDCDASTISGVANAYCELKDVASSNIKPLSTCSNHGTCDKTFGKCRCDNGWKGAACNDNEDRSDVVGHKATGPFFEGSVLKLESNRDLDGSFDFVSVLAAYGKKEVFNVNGSGDVKISQGSLLVRKGVAAKAVVVSDSDSDSYSYSNGNDVSGGSSGSSGSSSALSVTSGKKHTSSGSVVSVLSTSPEFTGALLDLNTVRPMSAEYNFLTTTHRTTGATTEDGTGGTSSSNSNYAHSFTLRGDGSIITSGSVVIKKPDVVLNDEMPLLDVPKVRIGQGGVVVKDFGDVTLQAGSSFYVKNGKAAFNGGTGTAGVFSRSDNIDNNADGTVVIEHDMKTVAPFLVARSKERGDLVVVSSQGDLQLAGELKMTSGGIDVKTGGVRVANGGIDVAGGINVMSGNINLNDKDTRFKAQGGITSTVHGNAKSGISVSVDDANVGYSGTVLEMNGVKDDGLGDKYLFVDAKVDEKSVFTVTSNGKIVTNSIDVSKDVEIGGGVNINGMLSLKQHQIKGNSIINVDGTVSYLEIEPSDDHDDNVINGVINVNGEKDTKPGQIILIHNTDTIAYKLGTSDKAIIPPNTLLMFVYTPPNGWCDVTAAAAHVRSLEGVTMLKASKDLDIGDHSFTAKRLISSETRISEGEVVYYGAGGVLSGGEVAKIDKSTSSLMVTKLAVGEFTTDIDFKGNAIKNAALSNPTIDGVQHMNVDSFGVLGQGMQTANRYSRVAVFNDAGMLSGSSDLRWEEEKEGGGGKAGLRITGSIGGYGTSVLDVSSGVDFQNNILKNVVLEKSSVLKDIVLEEVVISNARLQNVSATDLDLGAITVEGITISELDESVGALLGVGANGKVKAYMGAMKLAVGDEGVAKEVVIGLDVDFGGNMLKDAVLFSGVVGGGELAIQGDVTATKAKLNFGGEGAIVGAVVTGAKIDTAVSLAVDGDSTIKGDAHFGGEVFIDGSLTVGGSVLGSGPYVDASDERFKKNVERLSGNEDGEGREGGVLEMLKKLDGVSYEIDFDSEASVKRGMKKERKRKRLGEEKEEEEGESSREIGFIAQQVEEVFPEMVRTERDGYKGVAYSRMTAALVEGVKELAAENEQLRADVQEMKAMMEQLLKQQRPTV